MSPTSKQILHIAIPSIISNITIPLLGLVDVAIVGHLGSASYIGAIALGGMLFNMIYWIFGFLRMGTSGLTAQSYGGHNMKEVTHVLMRSLSIGMLLACILLILQYPIRIIAFHFISASAEVQHLSATYFHICIWGVPATLGLYSLSGWFIGMQNAKYPMYIAITQNIVNIIASTFLVFVCNMKIEGIAIGTLIAQYAGLFMAFLLWLHHYGYLRKYIHFKNLFENTAMKRFFQVNRDIFFRTICLVTVTVFFTSTGASYGDVLLAVNTLLMQLFTLFSYIMDGFAYAGEALTGKCVGAADRKELHNTVRHLFRWGIALALLFTFLYATGGKEFLGLLTNDSTVLSVSAGYFYWVLAIPLVGFSAFLLDGICIGLTATGAMLKAMIIASVSFFLIYWSMYSTLNNHALWLSFISYLLSRSIIQAFLLRKYKDITT